MRIQVLSAPWGITLGSTAEFLRKQVLYIAISAIGGATFWAIGQRINPLTVLLYSLAIGNLIVPITQRLPGLYSDNPFPYNRLLFLSFLLGLLIPIYLISSAFVWLLAPPTPQTLEHLLRTGWKFPILITFVSSVLLLLYRATRGKSRWEQGAAEELERALTRALIPHDVKEYPDAGHSFMNNKEQLWFKLLRFSGIAYNEPAAIDARRRIAKFFHMHLD